MKFDCIYIYSGSSDPGIDFAKVSARLAEDYFPSHPIKLCTPIWDPVALYAQIKRVIISDPKLPLERQPGKVIPTDNELPLLYDGWEVQNIIARLLDSELDHNLHIVFTDVLTCTFDDESYRYHARPILCGTPAIISIPGIIEGPARSRQYYIDKVFGSDDNSKREKPENFIEYGDSRMTSICVGFALQAAFYYILNGAPFCTNRDCRLFNSHWQQDLVRTQITIGTLCRNHSHALKRFGRTGRDSLDTRSHKVTQSRRMAGRSDY